MEMDMHKAEKAERASKKPAMLSSPTSLVTSLFRGGGAASAAGKSSDLVHEMNKKMEAVLEETLLKNMQLQVCVVFVGVT
jgi:hypothetical protein